MHSPIYFAVSLTGICCLWLVWDRCIKPFCLDFFRERVFELRYSLFQLGVSGELPFDSDLYRTLEVLLCGLLRFGHRVTFLTFLFSSVAQDRARKRKDYADISQQISLKISRLDSDTQTKVSVILEGVRSAIVLYVAFTSLFFLSLFAMFSVARVLGLWHPADATDISKVIEQEAYQAEARRNLTLSPA